jgi:Gpi18-like mannosyltransferase
MHSIEKKALDFFDDNIYLILYMFISILAILIRVHFIDRESSDYITYLEPWFQQIKSAGGLRALNQSIGNYNVLYLTLMAFLTYIPMRPIVLIKGLSFIFDFTGAVAGALICKREKESICNMKSVMAYGVLLCTPQVFINSAAWAQCDFSYTAFILICILMLMKDRPRWAIIMFGIAFCFKLQAIFFLPVLLVHYVTTKKYSILEFFWIPAVWLLTSLPALLAGRSFKSILCIYYDQATLYQTLTLNYPNIYYIFRQNDGGWVMYYFFGRMGIILTFMILAIGCVYAIKKKLTLSKKGMLSFSTWCIFTCAMFLPSMHERYGFLAEILAICLAFELKNVSGYVTAILINIVASINYACMIFGVFTPSYEYLTAVNLLAYVILTYMVLEAGRMEGENAEQQSSQM